MHIRTLRAEGTSENDLRRAVRVGEVERIRQGWYGLPGDTSDEVRALRVGGRLTCVSLLRMHGVWLMPDTRLHVAVSVARSRLCSPADRASGLGSSTDRPSVVTHWQPRLLNPLEPTEMFDDAAACLAICLPRDHAIVAFDSLLNSKLLSPERLRAALAGLPDSHEWMLNLVDAGCGSGLETLARLNLRRRHIRVRSQVHIPPVGWIDLLIGDRLVLELDSRAHHTDSAAYERDRSRDLALIERGYLVIRVTYRSVMQDWPAIERAILTVVRRKEHRWQPVHRAAGFATAP
ncbi:type IV toxin-antitoxin system AbiEi family antitoxin domain-containing protein [Leifsonia kafniensis]|uniref:Type IV toxin-antitoxin system AbiEi family antitoxin domain-containing protein n=1 Tax=Leifsonia kafniensis TaxID=475957 RepID=A0ABP7KAQ0_9MICO